MASMAHPLLSATPSNTTIDLANQELINFVRQAGIPLLSAILILLVTRWAVRLGDTFSQKLLRRVEPTLQKFLLQIIRILIWFFGIVTALNVLGFQTTGLITVLGAAGLAIGLALQSSLSHIAAGLMLISFRPFEVGDSIEGGGVSGTVDAIGLFSTTIVTSDHIRITVPNSNLFSGILKNHTVLGTRRLDIRVNIGPRKLHPIMEDLLTLAEPHPKVLTHPKVTCQVVGLETQETILSLRPWCQSGDYDQVRSDLLRQIKEYLDTHPIEKEPGA